ncbi:hypothetical protein E2C01_025184 [Portunus trituberculatus]|uniref:Reverse transcriptase zinc-binding domain-containing protein n=1 Tax=Portunus trituberculatus TaxID=210409 RepID=A0A5B7EH62_PORTR|nr:hypothetical protein [Portunus trituberculatus]
MHCLRQSPDPFCCWCRTTPEAMEHFLLQCPHFHSQHTALRSRLSALAITALDLPTLLAASGIHLSWQPAVLRLTCPILRKTGQLPHRTTPGLIRIQKRPRRSMDPYEPWGSPVLVSQAW